MKQEVEKLNFWVKKVVYSPLRTAQDILKSKERKSVLAMANSECYGTCGDDYDTGCASNSECAAGGSDGDGDGGDDS